MISADAGAHERAPISLALALAVGLGLAAGATSCHSTDDIAPDDVELRLSIDGDRHQELRLTFRGRAAVLARAYKHAPHLLFAAAGRSPARSSKNRPEVWPDPG